jgi:hypothetical protein
MCVFQLNTAMDLQMVCGANAKERTRRDWEELLKSEDHRLKIVAVKLRGGVDAVIEVASDE